eukprot:TRINITY_DN28226_c0_g2_i1.p1 TRINITY_DN28226_c0_g2~~TRINITY_DN28226_c0_g2_i1.p1  ORF type:complete len:1520 (-),score=335.86 TRINITY_DN28226_c0_g2_i1:70-4629(-)
MLSSASASCACSACPCGRQLLRPPGQSLPCLFTQQRPAPRHAEKGVSIASHKSLACLLLAVLGSKRLQRHRALAVSRGAEASSAATGSSSFSSSSSVPRKPVRAATATSAAAMTAPVATAEDTAATSQLQVNGDTANHSSRAASRAEVLSLIRRRGQQRTLDDRARDFLDQQFELEADMRTRADEEDQDQVSSLKHRATFSEQQLQLPTPAGHREQRQPPSPHLIRDTWYDKVGAPEFSRERQESSGAETLQPADHLVQGHRDSFRNFLRHGFGRQIAEMQPMTWLTGESIVVISDEEAKEKMYLNPQEWNDEDYAKHTHGQTKMTQRVSGATAARLSSLSLQASGGSKRFTAQLMHDCIYYVGSKDTPELVRRNGDTFMATAFLPVKVTDGATGFSFDADVELGRFPMMHEQGNFTIGGNPYVIVHRLCRSPGPYFSKSEAPKSQWPKDLAEGEIPIIHTFEMVTLDYSRLRCESFRGEPKVKMPKGKVWLPAGVFLLGLGLSRAQIGKARNKERFFAQIEHIDRERGIEHACEQLCELLEVKTELFKGDAVAAFNFKTKWATHGHISSLGRRRFNARFGNDLPDMYMTPLDILAALDAAVGSDLGTESYQIDDIDSLENKRLRSAGEVMEELVRRWLKTMQDNCNGFPLCVDAREGTGVIDRFTARVLDLETFCVKELWKENNRQLGDEVNALSGVMQGRKITQVSELGLDKIKRITSIRLIHDSHYGRICPIETADGMSAGIVAQLAAYSRLTPEGEVQAPHQRVVGGRRLLQEEWEYLLASTQFSYTVAQFDTAFRLPDGQLCAPARPQKGGTVESLDTAFSKAPESVTVTHLGRFGSVPPERVEYIACGPPISAAVALIPFVEHDDANRALMGAKMQQQSVPTLWPERPVVGSGLEAHIAASSGMVTKPGIDGQVLYADSQSITTVSTESVEQVSERMYGLRRRLRALYGVIVKSKSENEDKAFEGFEKRYRVEQVQYYKVLNELCMRLQEDELEELLNKIEKSPEKSANVVARRLVSEGIDRQSGSTGDDWEDTYGVFTGPVEENELPDGWEETEYCLRSEMSHRLLMDAGSTKKHTLNHDTCVSRPGDSVCANDFVAEATSVAGGELAIGKNLVVAYMPYEGYNYEDAVVVSKRCVREELLTSVHVDEIVAKIDEDMIMCTPGTEEGFERELEYMKFGVARVGTWLETGDLVMAAKRTEDPTEEDKHFHRPPRVEWKTWEVPNHVRGRVIDSHILTEEEMEMGVPVKKTVVRVLIAVTCRIEVGDKVAGRHGNKGIIANIVDDRDMPYLPDGTPIDMLLNPLGVPSRMNVGQIFENLLSSAGRWNGEEYRVGCFDEMFAEEASRGLVFDALRRAGINTGYKWLLDANSPGKTRVYDGRTGRPFDQPVTAGITYIIKLGHMVRDKIHTRASGSAKAGSKVSYSVLTMQPTKGRKRGGGQRLGEMEVSALVGYGASSALQEMMTVKSDDVYGREDAFDKISSGQPVSLPKGATAEGYRTFTRELAASGFTIEES